MFWREFCPGHRILCIEWWCYPRIHSFRDAFVWLNDTIHTDPGIMVNMQYRLLHSCLNLFHARPICKAALSSQYQTLNFVHAQRYKKLIPQKYKMHFLATQVLLLLDGDSRLPHFAPIHIKMWRWSGWFGVTAGHIRLFVPTESILMPSGSLYTNRSQIVPSETPLRSLRRLGDICLMHCGICELGLSAAQTENGHLCFNKPGHYWCRICSVAYSSPSHYLNQSFLIVNWTRGTIFQCNLNQNTTNFVDVNEFENVVGKLVVILCQCIQCINDSSTYDTYCIQNYTYLTSHSIWRCFVFYFVLLRLGYGRLYNHALSQCQGHHTEDSWIQ